MKDEIGICEVERIRAQIINEMNYEEVEYEEYTDCCGYLITIYLYLINQIPKF